MEVGLKKKSELVSAELIEKESEEVLKQEKTPDYQVGQVILERLISENILSLDAANNIESKLIKGLLSADDWNFLFETKSTGNGTKT